MSAITAYIKAVTALTTLLALMRLPSHAPQASPVVLALAPAQQAAVAGVVQRHNLFLQQAVENARNKTSVSLRYFDLYTTTLYFKAITAPSIGVSVG